MKSKYPYLDPEWIPLLRELISPTNQYDPNQTSEYLARALAYQAGKLDIVAKLESIIKKQQEELKHG
jgi:hypothetical protein